MLEIIRNSFKKHQIDSRDRLLLAISGGIDSTALLFALLELGFEPELAHLNFQLRGDASQADEEFCRNLARHYKLKFHLARHDTKAYAEKHKLSLQMAARNLRYAFFESLDEQNNYRAILTAHHADDQLETMIFKLARGSALESIAGIREKRQKFFRPMLGLFRSDIEGFMKERKLPWREDRSNAETKYLRNAYRHRLLPLWEDIQADLKTKMLESGRLLREQSDALNLLLHEKLQEVLRIDSELEFLDYQSVCHKDYFSQLLHYWLAPKGWWDWTAANHLWRSRKGRYLENEDYQLFHTGNSYELRPRKDYPEVSISIEKEQSTLDWPLLLNFSFHQRTELKIDGRPEHLFIDADALEFPLLLRSWKEGDRFQPLGMSGSKKLSDYWIDIKMPTAEKARQLVLESAGEIVGLMGHRIDHRFRVKNSTKTIYFVRLKK